MGLVLTAVGGQRSAVGGQRSSAVSGRRSAAICRLRSADSPTRRPPTCRPADPPTPTAVEFRPMRPFTGCFVFFLALACASEAYAQRVTSDIPYAKAHERQVLDVYAPTSAKNLPVVFWIHGGGWQTGDKSMVALKPNAFNDAGFVFVSINHRLLPTVEMERHHPRRRRRPGLGAQEHRVAGRRPEQTAGDGALVGRSARRADVHR